MGPFSCDCKIIFFFYWTQTALSMSLLSNSPFSMSKTEQDITDFIQTKGYLPNEKKIPKAAILKSSENDVTYLLSKLSDEDLVKLLSEQPHKNEYNVKDLVTINSNSKYAASFNPILDLAQSSKTVHLPTANHFQDAEKKRFRTVSDKTDSQAAFFRLDQKEVDPFATRTGDMQYAAIQKLNNMLYSRPAEAVPEHKNVDDDEKRELLFDVLVAQLKTLCCKREKGPKTDQSKLKLKSLISDIMPKETVTKSNLPESVGTTMPNEHMFLILNDDIKSNGNEGDLISVDPESLGKNSSVMLLGPIATPLSDVQLKVVMMRISNELSKPEYLPLLQQISDGKLKNEHIGLVDSVISGPQTRRYIKPHRCNEQSQITRIYGGPKWIICTGYLNLNTPSLYD